MTAMTSMKLVSELEPGDVLVGDEGGRSVVNDTYRSSSLPGLTVVGTEHGALYIDTELEVPVLSA